MARHFSHRAFASLKAAFPTWEEVAAAPSEAVEDSIRQGGLAATKTARIKLILQTRREELGEGAEHGGGAQPLLQRQRRGEVAHRVEHLGRATREHVEEALARAL